MRKLTFILFALIAGSFAMQMNAAPGKAPARSAIYHSDQGFTRLGNTSIFYDISRRSASGPGYQYGISILGRVNNTTSYIYDYDYYSSTYENNGPGAGFIAAFQVNGGTADYLDARNGYGTTIDNVRMTARLEPQGDVAARVVYTLTNNNDHAVTVNAGVWGDIMIGDNDEAPLECMRNTYNGATYGIKMKYRDAENTPLLCALFGDHVTGVTAADTCWFGFYSSNWHPNEICGAYSSTIYPSTNHNWDQSYAQYYMIENGTYDSGLGFCWTGRDIPAHESIELSYLISVGEVDFLEPFNPDPDPEPDEPQPVFTYNIQAYDCEGWNNYGAPHPVKVWGEYVHAYGQNGYLEYQVDDENTWHTIGELISGAEDGYEFDFNVSYNPNRTTDHVVAVRYNDGLGNTVPLEGLTWVDVRSYPVSQYINTYEYTGSPVSFVVNVNGEDIVIGANDEYINEGTYNVVVAQGAFAEGTIGVLSISFTISKPTAVEEISVANEENGAWYTIDGRRITAPSQPGIYIRNGKKYYVK
ncbi:MAG: hypothetical protein IJK93_01600 [Muribaculaceae bacterium]|nr:hypothetical protein [Muribaculaceae bacterium]